MQNKGVEFCVEQWLKELERRAQGTFWEHLGGKVKEISPDQAVVTLEVRQHHLNPMGMVHGGVLSSLIDNAMGLAAMSTRPNQKIVTTNLNVHFVAPFESGTLTATARVVHASRSTLTLQADVKDEQGRLGTLGSGSFRIVSST